MRELSNPPSAPNRSSTYGWAEKINVGSIGDRVFQLTPLWLKHPLTTLYCPPRMNQRERLYRENIGRCRWRRSFGGDSSVSFFEEIGFSPASRGKPNTARGARGSGRDRKGQDQRRDSFSVLSVVILSPRFP
jgi:hypothetical protein